MMRWGFDNGFYHMGLYGGVVMFLIGLAIIGLLVYVVLKASNNNKAVGGGYVHSNQIVNESNLNEKAILILNERFAKGEIQEDEYLSRKNAIQKF